MVWVGTEGGPETAESPFSGVLEGPYPYHKKRGGRRGKMEWRSPLRVRGVTGRPKETLNTILSLPTQALLRLYSDLTQALLKSIWLSTHWFLNSLMKDKTM